MNGGSFMNITSKAPLFQDPIYNGVADPVIIWNRQEEEWWILYTNRRAFSPNVGVGFVHGTDIGIASSKDGGQTWTYRGIINGLEFENGRNTFWAPEVIYSNGLYHMYVSYVQGIPTDWNCDRKIIHYTSENLWNWKFQGILPLSSNRVIDACIYEVEQSKWKMWYKDEVNGSHTYVAVSNDLYNWKVIGEEITDCAHEGPNVFYFKDSYWMITDPWEGLGVYKSNDAVNWERKRNILDIGGNRTDDGTIGAHGDVLVYKNRAYIFYFTHPELTMEERNNPNITWEYKHRRTSLQVAELTVENGELKCNRNEVNIDLFK